MRTEIGTLCSLVSDLRYRVSECFVDNGKLMRTDDIDLAEHISELMSNHRRPRPINDPELEIENDLDAAIQSLAQVIHILRSAEHAGLTHIRHRAVDCALDKVHSRLKVWGDADDLQS